MIRVWKSKAILWLPIPMMIRWPSGSCAIILALFVCFSMGTTFVVLDMPQNTQMAGFKCQSEEWRQTTQHGLLTETRWFES